MIWKVYQYFNDQFVTNQTLLRFKKKSIVPLMWQWNVVLNLKLYFFYVQKLQWHEHFLELGNQPGYYSVLEENYYCDSKAIISINFQCNKSICKILVFLLPTPKSVLSPAKLRLIKGWMYFVYVENTQISFYYQK